MTTKNLMFPQELTALPNWLCWRLEPDRKTGRDMKVPYNPTTGYKASTSNLDTWGTFDAAVDAQRKYLFSGLGFVFTTECGIIGIDIDKCLTDVEVVDVDGSGKSGEGGAGVARIVRQPNEVAVAILERVPPTYIEISPSGRGLHIFLRGEMPRGGNKNSEHGVEMYGNKRYFTMTGNRWKGYAGNSGKGAAGDSESFVDDSTVALNPCVDEIALDSGSIQWIFETFIKPKKPPKSNNTADGREIQANNQNGQSGVEGVEGAGNVGNTRGKSHFTDEKLQEAVRSSKDADAFGKLWDGKWQDKYKSQSEADFAMCCKLAFWSNHDIAQMDRLFRSSGLFREKWDSPHYAGGGTYGEVSIRRACEVTKETYKPKSPKTRRSRAGSGSKSGNSANGGSGSSGKGGADGGSSPIFEMNGAYYKQKGEKIERLTNFIINPIEILQSDDEAQLNCEMINVNGKVRRQCFLADDFTNLQRFKKVLNRNSISYCFFGNDKSLEDMKEYIERLGWKEKRGVKALGIYRREGKMVFVTHNKAIAAGGEEIDSVIQLEKHRDLESKILEHPFLTVEQLSMLGELILAYNEPTKTVPILSWVAACFIKPFLRRKPVDAKFPHLFLIGEQGSGKSATLEKIVLPMFAKSKILASSQVTGFSIMKESSSSNVIVQAINEFKPSTLDRMKLNILCNHFRDAYDGHEGVRGRADQTSQTYELLAPIAVVGEESAQEAAIRERTIELLFSKHDLENDEYVAAFKKLRKNDTMLASLGRTLLDTALQATVEEVAGWYNEGESLYTADNFPARVTSNLACMYAGLKLVERMCINHGHSWYSCFKTNFDDCAGHLSHAVREYLLDGSNYNKSIIVETFEVMARMRLKANADYCFEAAGRHLCLKLETVYDKYTKYRKDYAIVGEVLSLTEFRKQFKKSKYCIKNNATVRMNGKVTKVWKADYEALSQVCDVSGFMEGEDEQDDDV